jgi:uncharacterized protein (DUF488 family)
VVDVEVFTVGHGTLGADEFVGVLQDSAIEVLVDVRSYPGSRRHPHFARERMAAWVPEAGVAYRWERRLGGRRPARADSVNVVLRNDAFRGYADHMASDDFLAALGDVVTLAAQQRTAVMCSESVWWRCHRRLLSDALHLVHGASVVHLMHDGRQVSHPPTDGARVNRGHVVYDIGATPPLPL